MSDTPPGDSASTADTTTSAALTAAALIRLAREDGSRIVALLARRFGDLDLADDCVQDALVEAAETWPRRGVPDNTAAWLLTVARNRAIDRLRRSASARRRTLAAAPELIAGAARGGAGRAADAQDPEEPEMISDSGIIRDERLRLLLLCCHPALDRDTQVALTLRLVGGLTTPEIASAFLLPEATLAQRIVRAKRKIRDAGIPLSIPAELGERIEAVLAVIYLVFNEGYLARGGEERVIRIDLIAEAIRLTRLADTVAPGTAEIEGLLALELFHTARRLTRTDSAGDLVLLDDQDRSRWDLAAIEEGKLGPAPRDGTDESRPLPNAGGDRGLPRERANGGGHRLASDRAAVSAAVGHDGVPGRGPQPRCGGRDGRRTTGRTRDD